MRTLARHLAVALLSALVLVGVAGCGGDDGSGSDSSGGSSAGSSDESTGSSDSADDSDVDQPEGDQPDDGAAPAGGAVFVDASAGPASEIVTITKAGFDPQEVTVAAGDDVKFTAPDDGIFGVIVADIEGKTVTKGLDEYFRFDKPGTYPVKEDVSGVTAAVTVK